MEHTVKINWLGHACFQMEYRGWSLIVDPYADGSVPGLPKLRASADAAYCSHGHGDHNAVQVLKLSGAAAPADFAVETVECPHDDQLGVLRGGNTVHIFHFGALRVAHLGDIGCFPEETALSRLRGCDALLLPVGGFYTIDGETAWQIVQAVRPGLCVPMHYRGEGFGFEVLSTVEPFAAHFPRQERRATSSLTLPAADSAPLVILSPPLK